jgi:hypothetical protein
MQSRVRKVTLGVVAAILTLSGAASPGSVRPSALLSAIRAPRAVESDDVRIVEGRPQLSGRRSIVIDIDRDGDLDVVGSSSDAILAVWINDGTDHFTRTIPAPKTTGLGDGAEAYRELLDGTVLAAPPAPKWFAALSPGRAPRTPDLHAGARPSLRSLRVLRLDYRATPTRAPPALVS